MELKRTEQPWSPTRLQDEYNTVIRECDLFVMLFFTKVGKYTAEEFETAFGQFKETGKPLIYTYFKNADISTGTITPEIMTMLDFKKKLGELGHFFTAYKGIEDLKYQFSQQLDKLLKNKAVRVESDTSEPDVPLTSILATKINVLGFKDGAKLIGEGGFAGVYKAYLLDSPQTPKAVKVPKGDHQLLPSAELLRVLRGHDGLVPIEGTIEYQRQTCLIMPYAGHSLKWWIAHHKIKPQDTEQILTWMRELLEALAFVHASGFVHQDLKPSNLLIDEQTRRLRIADFGIAQKIQYAELKESTTVRGTICYMSPEQQNAEIATPQSDLFSFGVILYELLTGGKRPQGRFRDPIKHNPQMPQALNDLILTCLENDPEDRYTTADDVLRDLIAEPIVQAIREEPRKSAVPKIDLGLVKIKGGTFEMGDNEGRDNEKPVHTVTLSDFEIGKYPVTVGQFATFIAASGYKTDAEKQGLSYIWTGSNYETKKGVDWRCDVAGNPRPEKDYNHPVIHVSWNDATAFCQFYGLTLPSEAQWEYAARSGGKTERWAGTNDETKLDDYAWYDGNSNNQTHPAGQKKPNGLGLYDMSGNVWEWCADWYDDKFYQHCIDQQIQLNPLNTKNGINRSLRGGSWLNASAYCRVAYRLNYNPDDYYYFFGFRVVSLQDSR